MLQQQGAAGPLLRSELVLEQAQGTWALIHGVSPILHSVLVGFPHW